MDLLGVMGSIGFGVVCGWLVADGVVRTDRSPSAAGMFGTAALPVPAVAYLLSEWEAAAIAAGSVGLGVALLTSWRSLLLRVTAHNPREGSTGG